MNWYYVDEGRQAGPVDEAQFNALIRSGKVSPQTLVWKEGMPQWQPWSEVMPAPPPGGEPVATSPPSDSPALQGNQVACAECGQTFPREETIQYGSHQICAACKPVFLQRIQQGVLPGAASFEYAGFWIRFAAKFIDGIILMFLLAIPVGLFLFTMGGAGIFDSNGNGPADAAAFLFQILLQVGTVLISVLYSTWFLGRYGATPGKMACGLRVITGDGRPVTYLRAFGRGWAEQLSGWICYIGYIIVVFDDQKRALHDHICNTRVIRK